MSKMWERQFDIVRNLPLTREIYSGDLSRLMSCSGGNQNRPRLGNFYFTTGIPIRRELVASVQSGRGCSETRAKRGAHPETGNREPGSYPDLAPEPALIYRRDDAVVGSLQSCQQRSRNFSADNR